MEEQDPILTLKNGLLRGEKKVDWQGRPYYSFKGIPYAKPPVGKLRFKAPNPAEPWYGVRDATSEGSESYSRNMGYDIVGSEDCLYLNVYTPKLPILQSTLKPVMVWIHGGGFIKGSSNSDAYGPDFLIAEDVVVVTINYRLGLLGFASFEDPSLEIPGNAGLKDQVLALTWIQHNIVNFCGNPNNVTIFGESAGGCSVHYLMLSPMAKGLFHRAIAQSGVSTSLWARGQRTAPLAAKALGLSTFNESIIVNILSELSGEEIFSLQEKIPDRFAICEMPPIGPIIETSSNGVLFLSEDPVKLMKSGKYNQVPFMLGYNSRDGMLLHSKFSSKSGKMIWNSDFEEVVPYDLKLKRGSELSKTVAERIERFYYGNDTPSMENIHLYYILQTDNYFFTSTNNAVQYQTISSSTPIYYYRLSIDTKLNVNKTFHGIQAAGTNHGDELGYLFKNLITPKFHPKSQEDISLRRIIKLWTTFAKYGNPNPIEKDPLITVTWPPVERERFYFLDIGENLTVGVNPEAERVEFWNEIYSLNTTLSKL